MTDTDALRVFLLDLLTTMPTDFLATEEGRADVVMSYERMADAAHPAVADVLREAARRVKG
ncbi:hypothetical protein [Paracoccus siganidrum]|nr:hypothetical protein [Paracoccus siganidrum]RMC40986.1 hypothetical protein C9E82_00120 [Paracoccus siganidrum]